MRGTSEFRGARARHNPADGELSRIIQALIRRWHIATVVFIPCLLASALVMAVFLASPASASGTSPAEDTTGLAKKLTGTWRSVGEASFPDVTFHEDGSVSFSAESRFSTTSGGCDTNDVKAWSVVDADTISLSGESGSKTVHVREIDQNAVWLTDDGSQEYMLIRVQVFENPPVLLVHGINGSTDNWADWVRGDTRVEVARSPRYRLEFARSAAFGAEVPVFLLDYSNGDRWQTHESILVNAESIPWAIDSLSAICSPGAECPPTYIVAHSMGGLLARSYLQSLPSIMNEGADVPPHDSRHDVLGLATIGTPHGGSWALRRRFDVVSVGTTRPIRKYVAGGATEHEMHPDSKLILNLNSTDLPADVYYAVVVGGIPDADYLPRVDFPEAWLVGDGVVSLLAQVPYCSGRGSSLDRFKWFVSSREVSLTAFNDLKHTSGGVFDWIAGTAELSDEETRRFIVGHYQWSKRQYER